MFEDMFLRVLLVACAIFAVVMIVGVVVSDDSCEDWRVIPAGKTNVYYCED